MFFYNLGSSVVWGLAIMRHLRWALLSAASLFSVALFTITINKKNLCLCVPRALLLKNYDCPPLLRNPIYCQETDLCC
jgi:hypothetical protein